MAENCEVNHSCIHLNGGQEKQAVKRRVWQSGALSPSWWMGHFLQPSSTQVSITAGDLGLRVNWVHGQFPGTLRCLNGVLHKFWQNYTNWKVKGFKWRWQHDEEFYCASRPLRLERIGLWRHIILHFYKRTSRLEIMENGFVPSSLSNLFRDYGRLCKWSRSARMRSGCFFMLF